MTSPEMSREFKILYDNISSSSAPGLNEYEISLFLTKSQEEHVRNRYSPFNKTKKSFESSENRRTELKELITPYSSSTYYTKSIGISPDSKFFEIPSDVFYIIQEEIILDDSTPGCTSGITVPVKPITHDEYNISKLSPFRKPNKRKAWRLDIQRQLPDNNDDSEDVSEVTMVEIITPFIPSEYRMRYLKQPLPIITASFESDPELAGLGLTIDNRNTLTNSQLSAEIHRSIVDRAVELAILAYRENTLQANVELNNRNV